MAAAVGSPHASQRGGGRTGESKESYEPTTQACAYANVVATVSLFLVIGGGTATAAIVVSSNSQVASNTISGHHPPSGKHANIIGGSVNATDLATGAVTNPKLGPAAVTAAKVQGNSLTGQQINESTLSGVNAASLGGKTASQFIQGTGSVFANSVDIAASTSSQPVLNVPGIGDVKADCNPSATGGSLIFLNSSPNNEDYMRDNTDGTSSAGALTPSTFVSRGTAASEMETFLVRSEGKLATIRVVFITPGPDANVPASTCRVYAQAVASG